MPGVAWFSVLLSFVSEARRGAVFEEEACSCSVCSLLAGLLCWGKREESLPLELHSSLGIGFYL